MGFSCLAQELLHGTRLGCKIAWAVGHGRFLSVNGSALEGPWVLSPWLRALSWPCELDVTVFLHPRQKGRYTVWLIERDKPPLALLTTEPPHITG
ncbi:hypothetical protein AOLI_G00119840 [Acnodon oligacanthus]